MITINYVFNIILVGIACLLWRNKEQLGLDTLSLKEAHKSTLQHNYLSITVLTLGLFLIMLSIIGFCSSRRIESN